MRQDIQVKAIAKIVRQLELDKNMSKPLRIYLKKKLDEMVEEWLRKSKRPRR